MRLSLALIYGILAALAAFLLEVLCLPGLTASFFTFILAAGLEESAKLLFLFQWQKRFMNNQPSFLVQGAAFIAFGIGFALVELWLAAPLPPIAALMLAGVHMATALILGSALFLKRSRVIALPLGLLVALGVHALYNLSVRSLQ